MPLVRVRHSATIGNRILERLGPGIAEAVAEHFTCTDEGGTLTGDDVEVIFDPASQFDVNHFDLLIDVEAMHFPRRDKGNTNTGEPNFKERAQNMGKHLREKVVPGHLSFGLWVKLNNAQWFDSEAVIEHSVGDMLENADPGE